MIPKRKKKAKFRGHTKTSAVQPISSAVISILDMEGSSGNSTIFRPNGVNSPVLSKAPRTQSWYIEVRMLS